MSETHAATAIAAPPSSASSYKNSRWSTLVEQGMVIPLEELPLDPQVFQQRTAQALYQLAKEVFDLRQELRKTKESVQKARRQKKVIEFVEEPEKPIATGNAFDLLNDEED